MKKYFLLLLLTSGMIDARATVVEIDVFIEQIYESGITETDVASSEGIG